ncbi:hypothetical protein N136_01806 [Leifsonia aquatica ATCC 14665]|uniref:Uncharacterized protein n=1 Tax=Leifsonia aquatica ATCC 14665 TaxID=1358026 RepID=U2RTG0_LEIAQ|nr:hypothetical protein N136_01806 [Leifsonia aquatica ATCC 14665]
MPWPRSRATPPQRRGLLPRWPGRCVAIGGGAGIGSSVDGRSCQALLVESSSAAPIGDRGPRLRD